MITVRHTVHISDDSGRIAMLEKRIIGTDDSKEVLTRYVYSNHLQSASLELDQHAAIVSYEEYHPYGTTAFQAKSATINAVAKRYRYTGKERDEESGLYYHGARYYIPWLCRWTAIDPMESKYAGMSPYNYSFNNPVMWNDLNGADPDENLGLDPSNPAQADGAVVIGSKLSANDPYTYSGSGEKGTVGTALNDATLHIPGSYEVARFKNSFYVASMRNMKTDEVYLWNKEANWYVTESGKSFENPWHTDIYNYVMTSTKASVGTMAEDAIAYGNPFKTVGESYDNYKDDGGSWGVAGFLGTGIKNSLVGTYEDLKYGGQRRTNALIGIWQFASSVAKGSVMSKSPISISLGTKERLTDFTKKVGCPNHYTWEELGYHSSKAFDDAFHTTMEKVVKSGGKIAMDITDMDLELSKMVKGLGLYDEASNPAIYGAKYVRYTDWELGQVLSNKDYFKRVIFYNNNIVQNKMKIYNKYYGN